MRFIRPLAAPLVAGALLTLASGLPLASARADEESKIEAESASEEAIIGPYFAGLVAGLRGDATNSADFLLEVVSKVEPAFEVLGPALRAAISAGRIEEALAVAELLTSLDPAGSEPALLLLFTRDTRAEAWEAARDRLTLLPGNNLSNTRALLLEAWVTLPEEGVEAALEILSPLAERRGLTVLHDLHEALLLDVAGSPKAAEAYKALLEGEQTPSGRSVMLASNYMARSGDLAGAIALIDRQLNAGRGNATLVALREELASMPDGQVPDAIVASVSEGVSEVFLQIGAALADEGPGELALQEARMANYAAPGNTAAILLLSEVLSRLERHDEAVAGYDLLLDDPRHGRVAALARADALASAKRIDEALGAYRALAADRTESSEPLIRMGNLLRWERRFEESREAYDQAVLRSGEPDARDWLLYYFRGISNERSERWEQAEADFQQALALRPDQPQVLNYLGYSWVDRGENLDEALSMLKRAVELRPQDGYIVDSLGWALYKLGDFQGAVTQLERAVELEPGQAVINDHLGDAYWRVGRKREAIIQWQRTLSLGEDPDIEPAEVELKLVEGLPPVTTAPENTPESDGGTL
ncbi:MAG: tetratricopeptide repeat protein [Kiloniellales bacterium]